MALSIVRFVGEIVWSLCESENHEKGGKTGVNIMSFIATVASRDLVD